MKHFERFLVLLLVVSNSVLWSETAAFVLIPNHKHSSWRKTKLEYSNKRSGQFDISKPVFDAFTLRSIRGDALLRYNSLNQSEPLRINLYALLSLTLFSYPLISEAVGGDPMGALGTGGSTLAGIGSLALFVRECQRRSRQLSRLEKELNSQSLQLRLPMNALSDVPFTEPATLGTLMKATAPPRIVALCGTSQQLASSLQELMVFGRRLRQAGTFVVPVPTDGSTRKDWGMGSERLVWLADAYGTKNWLDYFEYLSLNDGQFRWFGINSNGRSFGSGIGQAPEWLQLMGQYLRPTVLLDESDPDFVSNEETGKVLEAQKTFYSSLIDGDRVRMQFVCSPSPSPMVTQVIDEGGRLDSWDICLQDGARPAGMKLSGQDAMILSETKAVSTVIEFPANASSGGMTATLLAVQEWTRSSPTDEWKLTLHQTIPWTSETRAQGTLRCDCRGCVALTREAEKRTFGGIIG
jgi:hypothetical protein